MSLKDEEQLTLFGGGEDEVPCCPLTPPSMVGEDVAFDKWVRKMKLSEKKNASNKQKVGK